MTTAPVLFFADLTLDSEKGRLIGPSGDVALRAKSFAVLAHLARNAGRVVAKEELIAAVWPDVNVTEDSLTQCISDIRRALGPDSENLLRTIPRRGYLIPVAATAATSSAPPPQLRITHPGSLAILPFHADPPLSPHYRLTFDGLASDITSHLQRLRSFHVISRFSTFALRDMATDPCRAGAALGVAYVVAGTVEPRGAGFRLQIELIRVADGVLIWTDEIALRHLDVLETIATLTDRITNAVAAEITLAERQDAMKVPDTALDAWASYHRGMGHVFSFQPDRVTQALGYFARATVLDPGFARAHACQSFCHYYLAFSGASTDAEADKAAARQAADLALQADDSNPAAHWAYGRALWLSGQSAGGLDHSRRSVDLCPGFAHAHYMVGFIEALHGDPQQALTALERTEALSPFDPFLASIQITRALALVRQDDLAGAAQWARAAVRHSNVYAQILGAAAPILSVAGHQDEALGVVRQLRALDPGYGLPKLLTSLYDLPQGLRGTLQRGAGLVGL